MRMEVCHFLTLTLVFAAPIVFLFQTLSDWFAGLTMSYKLSTLHSSDSSSLVHYSNFSFIVWPPRACICKQTTRTKSLTLIISRTRVEYVVIESWRGSIDREASFWLFLSHIQRNVSRIAVLSINIQTTFHPWLQNGRVFNKFKPLKYESKIIFLKILLHRKLSFFEIYTHLSELAKLSRLLVLLNTKSN